MHAPPWQLFEQHSVDAAQEVPSVLQVNPEPPEGIGWQVRGSAVPQIAEQHSPFPVHASPTGLHAAPSSAHVFVGEPEQVCEQQSGPVTQLSPFALQMTSEVHLFVASHTSEQQSPAVAAVQLSPPCLHPPGTVAPQLPLLQSPEQHSQSWVQAPVVAQTGGAPLAGRTQMLFVSPQFVEQQSPSAPQTWPRSGQQLMVWQLPSQKRPLQHSLVAPQLVPDPLHDPRGPHFPEVLQMFAQHWLGLVQSVPLLKQICSQTPLGHEPEQH